MILVFIAELAIGYIARNAGIGVPRKPDPHAQFRAANPDFKVLSYVSDVKDIQFAGDWAIEVGNVRATYKLSAKDAPVNVNDKGMCLLKPQSDGSWKFALVGLK